MNQLVQVILFLNCTKVFREEDSPVFNKIVYNIRNNQYSQLSILYNDITEYLNSCENMETKERLNYELKRLGLN
ncbi:unnamed protein product [Paramecium pentaurelia]|uniref:Uncharacterized protein n=1 Tax=Paramecium pentaurelia TaxID=43138 RepID=A0A8S1YKZ5_9CILI|nr:unnamed protein product [Paramecium pentaurelia]